MPAIGDPGSGSATVRTLGALNNGGGSDSDGGIAPLVNNLNKPVLSGLGKKALPGISTLGPIDGPKASSIEPSLSLEPNKDINNLKDKSSVSSNRSSVSSSTSSRVSKLKSVISDSGEFSASPVPTSNTSRLPQTDSEEKRKKKHRKSREESKEEDDRGSNRPKTSRHYATDSDDDTVDSRETRSNRKSKPQTHSKSQRAAEEEEKIRSANRKHNSQSPGVESPVNESGSKTRSRSSSGAQPIKNQKQQVHRETPTKSKHKSSSKYPKPKSKSAFDMTTPLSPPNEEDELVEDDDAIQSFDVNDFDVSPSSDEKHDKRGQSHSNSNREREMRRKEEDDILYTNTSSSGHKNQEGTVNKKLYGGRDKDDSSAWFTSSEEEEEDSHLFRKYNYSGDGESKEGSDSDSSHRRRQRELEKSVPSGIAGSVRFMSGTGETEVGAGFDDDDEPNKSGYDMIDCISICCFYNPLCSIHFSYSILFAQIRRFSTSLLFGFQL